jgi:hypothetical protein
VVKPLWALTGIALLGTAGVVGAVVVASSGGEEEVLQQVETATATPSDPTKAPSPTTLATPSPAPEPSPTDAPADWRTYMDPVLGFSLKYPSDLVLKDLTGPSPVSGVNERGYQFRSPTESRRSFTISVSSNTEGVTPESWLADHAACLPDTIRSGEVGGQPAAFCTSKPEMIPEAAVALPHGGKMLFITSILPQTDFDAVLSTFRQ